VSTIRLPWLNGNSLFLSDWRYPNPFLPGLKKEFTDRVPVEQPISVDGFRDDIVGVNGDDTVSSTETVPMAGTLGLGYIVRLAQQWTPRGLALGDLVYSLPLAPGEQQKVAIFERRDVLSVMEREFLTQDEKQQFAEQADTSALATFSSAFRESAKGGSEYDTSSSNWGIGGFLSFFGGGGGSASSSGSSSSWLEGQRSYIASAAESTHSEVSRQAAARRNSLRTAMRLASASEQENVTTKVITNHNHTRALTLQYWEVQRLFEISTAVEGVTLVCLVPLEVVRFLPPKQHLTLTSATMPADRQAVLDRYEPLLKHSDILTPRLPGQYREGLSLLRQFAADPTATVQNAGSVAEDVIEVAVAGTFLPFEDILVRVVTRQGVRLGPVRLSGHVDPIPSVHDLPLDYTKPFTTEDALVAYLRDRRAGTSSNGSSSISTGATLVGSIALPQTLSRNDVIGFELSRRFKPFTYELLNEEMKALDLFGNIFGNLLHPQLVAKVITLSPQRLEQLLGGPLLASMSAQLLAVDASGNLVPNPQEMFVNDSFAQLELPAEPMPIPAVQLPPELRYSQLLKIEQTLQYVVRNTVPFSKAVWQSLTPEERAIMLERYTIGVPSGGVTDPSQTVPLLNCVENRVLGYFGNSMIMPFMIPQAVAESMDIDTADVQNMLTAFHKNGFAGPRATIALPTRGVLGEAVLGHCPSAEKIDLTRFWNWADAPADVAPGISDVTVPTNQPSLLAGVQAPSTVGSLPPLINNFNASGGAPTPQTALVSSLISAGAGQKDFDTALTNAGQLATLIQSTTTAATEARNDAMKMTQQLRAQEMATAGNIAGGMFAGAPTAGSDAAKSVYGTGGADGSAKTSGSDTAKDKDSGKGKGSGSGAPSGSG
jgi:hypothetical protein